jgi:glc operon protein GlcG
MRTMILQLCAVAVATLASAGAAAGQLPQKEVLTLEAGRRIVAAAEETARANSWRVVIVVVDDGGHPILLQRMDGTQTASVAIALEKARSAAAFRRPTKQFAEWVATNPAMLALPGAIPIEGGIPLVVNGNVVGAIGVSGVTAQQDGVIAQAGVDALQRSAGR